MDKNTITGLVLIAILLVGFSFLSRPSEEQIAAQKKYYDSIAVVQKQEEALKAKAAAALANEKGEATGTVDSTSLFFNAMQGKESFTTIQNNLVEITFDNKGGRVYSAMLKDYNGQDGKPVVLFNGSDAEMNFNFYNKKETIQTKDYYFEVVNKNRQQPDHASDCRQRQLYRLYLYAEAGQLSVEIHHSGNRYGRKTRFNGLCRYLLVATCTST